MSSNSLNFNVSCMEENYREELIFNSGRTGEKNNEKREYSELFNQNQS